MNSSETKLNTKLNTKTEIANAFKNLMNVKPISKITVTDIIKECNINRNTFYYHFEDIVDLFKWIHHNEVIDYVKNIDLITDGEEVNKFIIDYLNKNRYSLNSAFDAFGSISAKKIFYDDVIYIVNKLINTLEKSLECSVTPEYKSFLCIFYTEAIFGLLQNSIQEPQLVSVEQFGEYVRTIMMSTLPAALENGPKA